MIKKVRICILLIIGICIICSNVKAADSNIFGMTGATGAKGEEVTVVIDLKKELAFASADITIEYDTSKLEYVKYTELEVLQQSAMNIVKNNTDTGKIAIGYVSNPTNATTAKSPGKMLSITFKIKANNGESTRLNLKCTSLKNDAGENIDVSDAQAIITVKANNNSNSGNSSNNSGSTNQNTSNNNEVVVAKEETTKAEITKLPKTGYGISVSIAIIALCAIISYYFYKKYSYLRKI